MKMAKLDDAAREAAEALAQLEREHQDQVGGPAISICFNHTSVCHLVTAAITSNRVCQILQGLNIALKGLDASRLKNVVQVAPECHEQVQQVYNGCAPACLLHRSQKSSPEASHLPTILWAAGIRSSTVY